MDSGLVVEKIKISSPVKTSGYETTSRQEVLYDWLTSVSTIPWFIGDQPLSPPQTEDITRGYIRLIDVNRTGQDGVFYTPIQDSELLNLQAYSVRTINFTLDVYSIDQSANYILQNILVYVKIPSTIEYFNKNGFGFVKYSSIRNLCLNSSGRWLNRYQADIKFNIRDNVFTTIDSISQAIIVPAYE